MSMQAAKILMSNSEARRILLGESDPFELQRKIFDVLTIPNVPDQQRAIKIAANSNSENLVAKTVKAATMGMSRKCGLTFDVAASNVFELSWNFLMKFADMPNRDIPRRFFGGLVWGIIDMNDKIDIMPYLARIVLAPKFPPFLYVTGGEPEAEIKRIVREWALENPGLAKEVLAEVKEKMKGRWAFTEPTPLGKMVAEAIFYVLVSGCKFETKLDIARVL